MTGRSGWTGQYEFPTWRDAGWNSFARQKERYELVRPFLGDSSVGAELGVYKGGFGEFLLNHCRKLYLVDTWYRAGGFWRSGIDADSRVRSVIGILEVYRTEIEKGRVEVVIENSVRFLECLSESTLDFAYVDSGHDYDLTRSELDLLRTRVKPGGVILGDDFDPDPASQQHGVYRAVTEFAAVHGSEMVLNQGR